MDFTTYFTLGWSIVGLAIMWLSPMALVNDLEQHRGVRISCMGALTFFIPILALLFIPILAFQKPDVDRVRQHLEKRRRAPIVRLFKGAPQQPVVVGPEQIAKATSLRGWVWPGLVFALVWPIVWAAVLAYLPD